MLETLTLILSWLLLPAAIIAIVDDWFLRPARRLAALPATVADPAWLRMIYAALPVLVIGGALRLFRSERLDFSLVLVVTSFVGALIWAFDAWVLRGARARAAVADGKLPADVPEPGVVDYARSMVPVVIFVLVLRSFLFEPFRIPSDSMMPTLQSGDFILVNKFHYGLRLPVLNTKILSINEPQRGDVAVFRYPPDPAINYIKRIVGLPGDRVKVISDRIYVNGVPLEEKELGRYSDGCYVNMRETQVHTGKHVHRTLSCRSPGYLAKSPLPGCNRDILSGYPCVEAGTGSGDAADLPDGGDFDEVTVPAGSYLAIGDNRDNSSDGRVWGFVPEANLVGGARRVWLNFDWNRNPKITWGRFGERIE
ncbi:MAG: signal peptidase I [Steroidobacteraceae bacterium]